MAVLQRVYQELGLVPERTRVANGREATSKVLDCWAYEQHITLDFFPLSKPIYS